MLAGDSMAQAASESLLVGSCAMESPASMKSRASQLPRSMSSGTLRKTGEVSLANTSGSESPGPWIPKHLSVSGLTRRRKLSASTGNLHGYMAEDYSQLNWPLPKMFGQERYGYSLIDIEDPRYVKDCAGMSKKLIRLVYDQQIIDLEWRKTYKALLDAEHRQSTLPVNCQEKTKTILKKEVDGSMKYLLELQEQKDMYQQSIQEVYGKCDVIKATIKKEADLEDLRRTMENQTKEKIHRDSPFWRTKFNIRSQSNARAL
mmetsp:Transcript_24296/g.54052  ORF Transcript_24296/g.54052 Transcript_24296/m.54052 type:complete len:260 (+) Transcript_24296:1-780(+)